MKKYIENIINNLEAENSKMHDFDDFHLGYRKACVDILVELFPEVDELKPNTSVSKDKVNTSEG